VPLELLPAELVPEPRGGSVVVTTT
jgi:hypothetical protein